MRILAAVSICSSIAAAQNVSTQSIPIRTLAPIGARTTLPVRSNWGMIHLPGNRLLVNDGTAHRLYLFDSTLASATVLRGLSSGSSE